MQREETSRCFTILVMAGEAMMRQMRSPLQHVQRAGSRRKEDRVRASDATTRGRQGAMTPFCSQKKARTIHCCRQVGAKEWLCRRSTVGGVVCRFSRLAAVRTAIACLSTPSRASYKQEFSLDIERVIDVTLQDVWLN